MDKSYCKHLFEHIWWANSEVGRALGSADSGSPELIELFAHVMGAELIWIDRIEGKTQSSPVWPQEDLEGCLRLAAESERRYRALFSHVEEDDLKTPIHYSNSAGNKYESRMDDILVHVALHGAYHRGQISMRIRSGGGIPAPTDYIAFVRGAPAATRADAESSTST